MPGGHGRPARETRRLEDVGRLAARSTRRSDRARAAAGLRRIPPALRPGSPRRTGWVNSLDRGVRESLGRGQVLSFKPERSRSGQASVRLDRVMQPTANEVAGRPSSGDDLVMASSAAQVARPAASAWLLSMDVSLRQPRAAQRMVSTPVVRFPIAPRGIADEAVTGGEIAIGRDSEIARTGPAGVRPMCPSVQFPQGIDHVQERIPLSVQARRRSNSSPQAIIPSSICSRLASSISSEPDDERSSGEKPDAVKTHARSTRRAASGRSMFLGVTVTRAEICIFRCMQSKGWTARR